MSWPRPGHLSKFLLALAALAALMTNASQAQGLAMAVDRQGEVEVVCGGKSSRLSVLDYLPVDAEMRLPAGASATLVYLANAQEWRFIGPGRYSLQSAQPTVLAGPSPKSNGAPAPLVRAMAKLEPVQRERMAVGAVVMRTTGPLRIISPERAEVLDARTTLIWQAPRGQAVQVTVFEGTPPAVRVQTVSSDGQWTLPEALPPGEYTWQLRLGGDAPGLPRQGRFQVIGEADVRRARLAATPQDFSQRVARAMLLESEDLTHDALVLWRQLSAERPDEPLLKQWAQ